MGEKQTVASDPRFMSEPSKIGLKNHVWRVCRDTSLYLFKAEQQLADELHVPDDIVDTMKLHNDMNTKQVMETMNILREAVKLAAKITGNNKTARLADKKMRVASPRLLSVVPEDVEDEVKNVNLKYRVSKLSTPFCFLTTFLKLSISK